MGSKSVGTFIAHMAQSRGAGGHHVAVVPWAPDLSPKRYRLASAKAVPSTAKCSAQKSANLIKVQAW